MKTVSGIELAKRIPKEHGRSEIIFIPSHFEFVSEGYEVDALHDLIKPIAEEKLSAVLSKATKKLSVEPPPVVIICDGETAKHYESSFANAEGADRSGRNRAHACLY